MPSQPYASWHIFDSNHWWAFNSHGSHFSRLRKRLHCLKQRAYKVNGLSSLHISANEERNSPPSVMQGVSTAKPRYSHGMGGPTYLSSTPPSILCHQGGSTPKYMRSCYQWKCVYDITYLWINECVITWLLSNFTSKVVVSRAMV